jgi:hypothetical protein
MAEIAVLCTNTPNNGRGSGASKCMAEVSQVGKWVRYMRELAEAGQGQEGD